MSFRILVAGQSNVDQWFHVADGLALETIGNRVLAERPDLQSVEFFDSAAGGSAVLRSSADQRAASIQDNPDHAEAVRGNHWFDAEADAPGPLLELFAGMVEQEVGRNGPFDLIIWAQGESDAPFVTEETAGIYRDALGSVLDALRDASGATDVMIQGLGDWSSYNADLHDGAFVIQQVQADLAADDPDIRLATSVYDLELRDSVHLTADAYVEAGERMAEAILSGQDAVAASSIHHAGDRVVLRLDLAPGQKITQPGSPEAFRVTSGGEEIRVETVSAVDGLILLQLENPAAGAVQVTYGTAELTSGLDREDFAYVLGNGSPILPFQLSSGDPASAAAGQVDDVLSLTLDGVQALVASADDDRVEGSAAHEKLYGNAGQDLLLGGGGDDSLWGGLQDDVVRGGYGDDWLSGGAGSDRLIGGEGWDTADYSSSSGAVKVFLDREYGRSAEADGDVVREVEELVGSRSGDRLHGDEAGNGLDGGAGDDVLAGMAGDDTVRGGEGGDTLIGGTGLDLLDGEAGDDLLRGNLGNDRIFGGAGRDVLSGGGDHDVLDGGAGDDRLHGNRGADSLHGGDGDDLLSGGSDHDLLQGGGGRDVLFGGGDHDRIDGGLDDDRLNGGSGNDVLKGGSGNDVLRGSSGNDTLVGGEGDDSMYGGSGADTFVFQAAEAAQDDTIIGFRASEGDRLDLGALANGLEDLDIRLTETGAVIQVGETSIAMARLTGPVETLEDAIIF